MKVRELVETVNKLIADGRLTGDEEIQTCSATEYKKSVRFHVSARKPLHYVNDLKHIGLCMLVSVNAENSNHQ